MREMVEININEELLKKIESLPDKNPGIRQRNPTEQEKEIIKKYWKVKRQTDLCKVLGVSVSTARRWYEESQKE